jgi:hypothetical protein
MRKPLAPLGCTVQAHVKPDVHQMWDTQSEAGFNIRTFMEHHRCFKFNIVKTRTTWVRDVVFFKHQYITNPKVLTETIVIQAAQ